MTENAFAAAAEQLTESTSNGSSSDSGSDEYKDHPNLKTYPITAMGFDAIKEIRSAGMIDTADGDDGHQYDFENVIVSDDNDNYADDAVITVVNPTVKHGTLFKSTNDDQYADYMLVDEGQSFISPKYEDTGNGPEQVGIDYYGLGDFEGEEVDSFDAVSDDDTVEVRTDGRTGLRLLRVLDANGEPFAGENGDDDGRNLTGLIEKPPSPEDGVQRVARENVERDDLGSDLTMFFYFAEGGQNGNRPHKVDVFEGPVMDDTGDVIEDNIVQPATNPDAIDTDDTYSSLYWDHDGTDGDGDSGDTSSFANASGGSTTYGDLHPTDQAYVDRGVDFLTGNGFDSTDEAFDSFEDTYANQVEEDEATGDVEASAMQSIIDNRV